MAAEITRTDKQRKRLITLLESLFQLDQPDLDFGFYKIMHAKATTVSNFLENDLLETIKDAFGTADETKIEATRLKYEQAIEQALSFGASDPEATDPVRKAKAVYDAAKNISANEGETYEHLYRFFERYYDDGDFMSRRYFVRETGSKAASYAIPYDGREVYLHWANRDQYYIKTSEYLTNFTFDIAKHFSEEELVVLKSPERLNLHCRIVDATEGEHNNNKTTDQTERFFLISPDEPVVMENGDLVLQFEYRPDSEKSGQAAKWQERRINEAESVILHALTGIDEANLYNEALRTEIGEGDKKRTLLRKYLNQYTKRNTTDYFIHKDLDSFLRRELDFYIKNEIMRLDDIESASAPDVEIYLGKIKVLRTIAGHLIAFLAQLEEFQKKLWLKKKFVTDTQYCITLDRIPDAFYADIAANVGQRKEWVKLFAIDDLDGYSEPLTEGFLKNNPFLILDTVFFPIAFKDALLASIQDLDETLDGLLIHSENFQALGLMNVKKQNHLGCIYIDPPYNSPSSEIVYKNSYKHSSWLSLMQDRIVRSLSLQGDKCSNIVAVDENEINGLHRLMMEIYSDRDITPVAIEHNKKGIQGDHFSFSNEFAIFAIPYSLKKLNQTILPKEEWEYSNLRNWGGESERHTAKNCFYPIIVRDGGIVGFGSVCNNDFNPGSANILHVDGSTYVYPIDANGVERKWRYERGTVENIIDLLKVEAKTGEKIQIFKAKNNNQFKTFWYGSKYNAGDNGTKELTKMGFKRKLFDFPKSVFTVRDTIFAVSDEFSETLDYFAGSGTTGHAVVNLNREDDGNRKYIMVEMGNYFDTVTRPRMQKVVYSKDWKDGKPISRDGISHAFKYIRLESYEDTLNNLSFKDDDDRNQALQNDADFRQGYMLKYWLDFETKGSPSLLNVDRFDDPTGYMLKLKKPGSDQYQEKSVDLVETFNWLIGLHVDHLDQWRSYSGSFTREPDAELPSDDATRLILNGKMEETESGKWFFRKAAGSVCRVPGDMNNMDRVLVIWRKLTANLEEDNLMLDEWFKKYRLSAPDSEFDVVYVNGSNNLQNLCQDSEGWSVRLIEKTFHQQMWDLEA